MNFPNYMFRRMNEQIVWQLIEHVRIQYEDTTQQTEQLILILSEWSVEHIFIFQKIYYCLLEKTHTTDLCAAAILNQTYTEEEFLFFKNWLILQGQAAYKGVLNDAEHLIELLKENSNYLYQSTTLHLVAKRTLQLKEENLTIDLTLPVFELEDTKAETQEDLIDKLPRLCQKLGWGNDVYEGNWQTDSVNSPLGIGHFF